MFSRGFCFQEALSHNVSKRLLFQSREKPGLFAKGLILHKSNLNPLPDDKFLDSSKLEEFADDNFKFDKNGRKLSKRVENTVGKGEIARYKQFLLLPQCFQKACFPGASKGVIVWELVKLILYSATAKRLPRVIPLFFNICIHCIHHFTNLDAHVTRAD